MSVETWTWAKAHFGVPLSSVEIKYLNSNDSLLHTSEPKGQLVVTGPAVAGGEVKLDIDMQMREDGCLIYA